MSSPLKYGVAFALILIAIIAFSAFAECPFETSEQAFCGAHDSRPLGRLAAGLAAMLPVAFAFGLLAMGSSRFDSAVLEFVRVPALLRASALRI